MTSIAAAIPAMDLLNANMNRQMNVPYHPSIQAVMKLSAKKLDKYYMLTDDSSLYRIAMGVSTLILHHDGALIDSHSPAPSTQA
jgi:hypothetical protein